MSQVKLPPKDNSNSKLATTITVKVKRKLQAREGKEHGVWFGLGMMGLIGWSVAIPTLLGISLGMVLDSYYPSDFSWTLALLMAGLVLGCFNAWHWVATEDRAIHKKPPTPKTNKEDLNE